MIDSNYRKPYQRWIVDPLVRLQWVQKFHPHLLTAFACGIGMSIALFLHLHWPSIALCALVLSGFLDTLDGSLARQLKITSPKGSVYDISADRMVEFSVILGLYLFAPQERALPTLLMLGSVLLCITSFLVVGIFSQNQTDKSFFYSPGLIERSEAFCFFALMILLPAFFLPLALLFSFLVFLTAAIRLIQFSKYKEN